MHTLIRAKRYLRAKARMRTVILLSGVACRVKLVEFNGYFVLRRTVSPQFAIGGFLIFPYHYHNLKHRVLRMALSPIMRNSHRANSYAVVPSCVNMYACINAYYAVPHAEAFSLHCVQVFVSYAARGSWLLVECGAGNKLTKNISRGSRKRTHRRSKRGCVNNHK